MKALIFILVIFIFIPNVFAACESGQININKASAEELDQLYGIGSVKAQAIIDARPFNSVDDLINVYGIGEATLTKIKEQGFACVEDESSKKEENIEDNESIEDVTEQDVEEEENVEELENSNTFIEVEKIVENNTNITKKENPITFQTINLNTKNINSEDNTQLNTKYSIYTLIAFLILIIILLSLRKNRYNKNEFS